MKNENEIRETVSKAYAAALKAGTGCGCGCSAPVQKGVVAKTAGYSKEELDALPESAVTNSFGCGNPLAYSEVKEGDVVLDLGSGAGIDILLAAQKVGATGRVIGVDMTDEMIEKARENIAASGLTNVEVRKGVIENLPVESGSVDWVVSNCVINLSPEKPKVFAEIVRVLKPGGRMSVSDIVVEDLPEWARKSSDLYCSCVAGAISEKEYIEGLKSAGLADVQVVDRLIYDASQLKELVKSELSSSAENPEHACCDAGAKLAEHVGKTMTGKIWSAKFSARKPL